MLEASRREVGVVMDGNPGIHVMMELFCILTGGR